MHKGNKYTGRSLRKLLWQYNFTLFLVVAAGGVIVAIYSLLGIISGTSITSSNAASTQLTSFDKETISRVQALADSSDSGSFTLPSNQRTDPFLEQ